MSVSSSPTVPSISFSRRREYTVGSPISFLMQQGVENPGVISLAAGLVDSSSLPVDEVRAAADSLFADPAAARKALQYGTTAGHERLRQLVLQHFTKLEHASAKDLGITPDELILTTGSQQFLSLVCEILIDPGDICLVAGPTYFVFLSNLRGVGAQAVTVPADEQGMRTDLLQQTLENLDAQGQLARVKLIYLVSYYENPSGLSLSEERRRKVVELARRFSRARRIFVLEDAAYRELRYDGPELPSIFSRDADRDTVLYTQTFSKSFSPGVRVGFGIAPPEVISALADRKGNEDFGSANLNQHLLSHVLEGGRYEGHVQAVRTAYRVKRDAMLAAADRYFTGLPGVGWVRPNGGLYVWMSLPENIETGFDSDLFATAVKEGVMYVPGELCYAGPLPQRPRHQMRLSFGVETPARIELGMQRLATAIQHVL